VSAASLPLGRRGKGKGKAKGARKKPKGRARPLPVEYSMLLTAVLCLLALGAVMVFSASSTTKVLDDGGLSNSAYYLKRTVIFGVIALAIMHVTARVGLQRIRALTPLLLGGSLFLLVAVLAGGSEVRPATSSFE
jgi:cell division protein FtsW